MNENYVFDFCIQSESGKIHLKIDKIFGFPEKTCHWGGYDTISTIEIKSSSYSVKGLVCISTGDIYNFFQELKKCYDSLSGTAHLSSYEKNLFVKIDFDGLGHIKITGKFRENYHNQNQLDFQFNTDQTFLSDVIKSLEYIYDKFGDNKGLKNTKPD